MDSISKYRASASATPTSASVLNRLRGPFNVTAAAQAAGIQPEDRIVAIEGEEIERFEELERIISRYLDLTAQSRGVSSR